MTDFKAIPETILEGEKRVLGYADTGILTPL
jgi:hypothetical protein